jgi:steroid 5-alpha reductase family enzyme
MFYVLFAVAAIITATGFYKFVYFLSTGYAFSVAGLAIAMLFGFGTSLNLPAVIILVLLALYASRLGFFLVIREYKSGAYRKVLDEASIGYTKIPIFVKIFIWIFCSCLYVMQVSPVYFRLQNGLQEAHAIWLYAGIGLIAAGLLIQWIADEQKNRAKKESPKAFCNQGLFKIVRCPNYFGEILVWSGVFFSSVPCLSGWFQILFSLAGYIGIVYVMFGSTRRLELRQNKNYGSDPGYLEYVSKTPVLFPFIPLYSVAKFNWIKG